MPSPFPGMDPYLEDPALWPDVHSALINISRELLADQLRPAYFARIDHRLVVVDHTDPAARLYVPDLTVRGTGRASPHRRPSPSPSGGGVAVAEPEVIVADPGVEIDTDATWQLTVHESLIEVRHRERDQVVTLIEVLSPANKVPGSAAFRSYNDKRAEALAGGCNVVEVDLLRSGQATHRDELASANYDADYFVIVSRPRSEADKRGRRTAWPISLLRPLPNVPVPLRPEDGDAVLPLQRALDLAYARADYDLQVRYDREPRPRLAPGYDQWAHDLLKARGLR